MSYQAFGQGEIRHSILKDGDWYKIKIGADSIFKMDFQFLTDLGLNPANINPKNIQIWSNPFGILPQLNSDNRPIDLQEISVYVKGENDEQFDVDDYILFFGKGPDIIDFNTATQSSIYTKHIYSDHSFYYVTVGKDAGTRIQELTDPGSFPIVRSYQSTQVWESDEVNRVNSGREQFQRLSSSGINTFGFSVPGFISSQKIIVNSKVMAFSYDPVDFTLSANGNEISGVTIQSVPEGSYTSRGAIDQLDAVKTVSSLPSNQDSVVLNFAFTKPGNETKGYLDYVVLTTSSELAISRNQTIFYDRINQAPITFEISGLKGPEMVWEISDPVNVKSQAFSLSNGNILFGSEDPQSNKYVVFNPDQVTQKPGIVGIINNQDIQGLAPPNLLIISPDEFLSEANRLAELRRSHDKLSVTVVTPEMIYNEFSSGMQDVSSIRDYIRYLYKIDNSNTGIQYVLLFGKGTFQFKGNVTETLNYVPIYESRNSLHPIYSYSSDDYFGLMEDHEGEWIETFAGDETMELGIGRLPVKTIEEARAVVDKYYNYSLNQQTFGDWRNKITFVADDGDNNLHLRQANRLSDTVVLKGPNLNNRKIFIDAYEQETLPATQRASKVNEQINEAVRQGTLIMNYTGHGNERQWASERILDWPMIDSWNNINKLPLFITATCEFGRHDDPGIISGGERIILKPDGGAIALVTTARPVFASQNFALNNAFYQSILTSGKEEKRLGDVFKETKNNSLAGSVNRNFSLLGDPSLRLAFPKNKIVIESINGEPSFDGDTLNALEKVKIIGYVTNQSNDILEQFNGILTTQLFEKSSIKRTLGDENPSYLFEERDNILFKGKSTVKDGWFSVEFIIPKNILYNYGSGKISMYASTESTDASGSNNQIVIGGSTTSIISDITPPEIYLFMEDTSFHQGMIVKPNTLLVARFFDESGITISNSDLKQNLQAILDDSVEFDLNSYYETEIDSYKKGWVHFPISGLETGPHQIVVKAWDTNNNPGEATISFIVSEKDQLVIENLRNYPNPMVSNTTFTFEHNRAGEDLEIHLQIYDGNGAVVKETRYEMYQSFSVADGIEWDGRNSTGEKMRPGIYYYRIIVRSTEDGAHSQQYQKLIIY